MLAREVGAGNAAATFGRSLYWRSLAQISYWTFVAAAPPWHVSFSGARSTRESWWLTADRPVPPVCNTVTVLAGRHERYRRRVRVRASNAANHADLA
jgi:hypothetical protein